MADRLGTLNTAITTIGAGLALFTSIFTWKIDQKTKELDALSKVQGITYTFADKWLSNLDTVAENDAQKREMGVAVLNVIAQSSTSASGDSDPRSRAELPLRLGLLTGTAGMVATIDRDFSKRDMWIEIPRTENDNVRLTAVRALSHIARYCAATGRWSEVETSVSDMLELTGFFMESVDKRVEALADVVKLGGYFERNDTSLKQTSGFDTARMKRLQAQFAKARDQLEADKVVLAARQAKVEKGIVNESELASGTPLVQAPGARQAMAQQIRETVNAAQDALDDVPASAPAADVRQLVQALRSDQSEERRAPAWQSYGRTRCSRSSRPRRRRRAKPVSRSA